MARSSIASCSSKKWAAPASPVPTSRAPWSLTSLLLTAGSRAQQERFLPAMARGERIGTLALTEESADFAPEAIAMQGDVGGRLNGSKLFVKDAHVADYLLVVVRGNGGLNLVLVERDQPDVTLLPLEVMSGEKLFEVVLHDVPVREDMLLGAGWPGLGVPGTGVAARRPGTVRRDGRLCPAHPRYLRELRQSARAVRTAYRGVPGHSTPLRRRAAAGGRVTLHPVQGGLAYARRALVYGRRSDGQSTRQ